MITQLRRGEIYPWGSINDYDLDQLIIKHMSIIEKREWLEVNKPKELENFFMPSGGSSPIPRQVPKGVNMFKQKEKKEFIIKKLGKGKYDIGGYCTNETYLFLKTKMYPILVIDGKQVMRSEVN